jgi:RsbT co-antagonist protein rsbRD N-terminal domain
VRGNEEKHIPDMKLRELLLEKKSQIVKKWFDAIIENYPADSSNFLKNQRDRFQNPVGNTIFEGIQNIFEEFLQDPDSEKIFPILNDIIKIKAVQNFPPSKALSFLFLLKKVIREEADSKISKIQLSDELTEFEAHIDKLILLSFDIYMKCRERIYEIKADEVRRMTFRLLQRANLICEIQEEESSPGEEPVLTQKIKG